MDALLRRRMMMLAGASPTPPIVGVPYIRGGADGSYIDTGITPDNTVKVIVWARNYNPIGGVLFGGRINYNNSAFVLGTNTMSGKDRTGRMEIQFGSTVTYVNDLFTKLSHYHKYELYQGTLKVDDETVITSENTSFSCNHNIHLFGLNGNGTHVNCELPVDICAAKIYKSGTLVRDFTAVDTPSVGLYDAVSDTVFTNAGSGSFTYGTFNQNAYTPLEYIECSGVQYFDSGAYAGYSVQLIGKFRVYNTYADDAILGYRGASDWCELTAKPNGSNSLVSYRLGASGWLAPYNLGSSDFVDQDIVFVKDANAQLQLYKNNTVFGSSANPSVPSSYVSSGTLLIAADKMVEFTPQIQKHLHGRLYYLRIGGKNFVPAKSGNIAGMYDTYNDVFYPSASGSPFIAGTTI